MSYLLDTNAWIDFLKNELGGVANRLRQVSARRVFLCSVVKAELWHGAQKYRNRERRLAVLDQLFAGYTSLLFDDEAARHYAAIRHALEIAGKIIGPYDLQIAAICRTHGLILVSANTDEFSRVPNLVVEDWTKG